MSRKVYYVIYLLFAFNCIVSANTLKTNSEYLLSSTKGVDFVRAINIENLGYNFKNPISEAELYKSSIKQVGSSSIFFPDFVWYEVIKFDFSNWIINKDVVNVKDQSKVKGSSIFDVDSDGDGILDEIDIDDDNDGIPDAVESPSCYYSIAEVNKIVSVTSSYNGAAGDPQADEDIALLYNGNNNDGAVAAAFNFNASQTLNIGSVIFNIEYPTSFVMSLMTIVQATNGMSNLGYGQLYGSNDEIDYTAISTGIRLNAANVTFTNTTTNAYKYYQIRYIGTAAAGNTTTTAAGVAAIHEITSQVSTAIPYVASAHPKPGPCTEDTDGDGIPNNLDLDSDGDGCFDAFEGGATTSSSVSLIPGPYGANGFADSLETSLDNGITNYISTYRDYGILANEILCKDSDTDGIVDAIDIDDDNDGIPDAVESPSCFYNVNEAGAITSVKSSFNGDTGDPQAGNNIPLLIDGNLNNGAAAAAYNFAAGQTLTPGAPIFTIEHPTSSVLTSVTINQIANGMAASGYGQLFGSMDGENYTSISNGVLLNTASVVFNNTTTNAYRYYQIRYIGTVVAGNTANIALGVQPIHEVTSQVSLTSPYVASAHPKPGPCTEDTDGDGTPNHLDLDSDGDGCFDAFEGSATSNNSLSLIPGPYGANGFADALETTVDSGITNYVSTYKDFALSATENFCTDTDGDGIVDAIDIDDDNDGILDGVESPSCFYNVTEANVITSVKSSFNGDTGDPQSGNNIPLLIDGNTNNGAAAAAYNFAAGQILTPGTPIFTIEFPTHAVLGTLTVAQTASGMAASGYGRLFGSRDGENYTVISNGILLSGANVTFTNTTTNAYKYYQIRYIGTVAAGNTTNVALGVQPIHEITSIISTAVPYNVSEHKKPGLCTEDTDSDNLPNYLDTDSDGDGCFDAFEGGASSSNTVSVIPGPYGANGLADSLETTVDSGITNFSSTYLDYALSANTNLCADADGDGIGDAIDIDDDNDGVLDAEESPSCFYNVYEANRVASVTSGFNGDTGDPQLGNNIPALYDDISNNGTAASAYNFAAGQILRPGSVIFNIEYPTSSVLRSMTVIQAANGITASAGYGQLYGSNDGSSYTAISNGVLLNTASVVFNVTTTDLYRYYQIRYIGTAAAGNASSVFIGVEPIHEITSFISTTTPYIASAHQKPGVCTEDTDGDGTPNHLDLDSDGDGCFDSFESGTTTDKSVSVIQGPYGENGFANSLETATDSGLINYKSTYYSYALSDDLKFCEDSDDDGVPDPLDKDKDNDGILDVYEQGGCSSESGRTIRVGYLNVAPANNGVMTNLLTNPANFGPNGVYNKVNSVIMVPFTSAAAVTEASLLSNQVDIFYVGSTASDSTLETQKAPSSVNSVVQAWAKTHNKGVFMIQNNAVDYGYKATNNCINPNVPEGTKGRMAYTDGYWPTPQMIQTGGVEMTIMSATRVFDILMVDANLRPVVVADREYNLIIFPDATIYNVHAAMSTPVDNDQRAIASTWAYVIDQFITKSPLNCAIIDTDGDGIPDYLDLDSDNDGCSDATEGSAGLPTSNLVLAGGELTGGTGSTVEENLCANGSCVNKDGIPLIIAAGQNIGTSKDANLGCFCYKPAEIASGVVLDASVGISSLGRKDRNSDGWPVVRKGAWLALESKNKGFVLNRIPTTAQVNAIPNPIEGMMVYDEESDCIKIYTTTDNVNYSWKCYDTQTCPDF